MGSKLNKVCNEILAAISPTIEDREKVAITAESLEEKVASAAKKRGIEVKVRVEGSVAKDTWLREAPDLDIFMCFPLTIAPETLAEVSLEIAREVTAGSKQIERFAEHPYLEAFVNGFRVNIVPCFCSQRGEWKSATDRTPFHTDYILKQLSRNLRDDVRLLKKFMQGIEVYGAEIKTGGFSGYLCELLILHYGSFVTTLRAFSECSHKMIIDIEGYYKSSERDLKPAFPEPLVVIDPVDKGRNVASAVQTQKIHTFVGAARAFLKAPSTNFFTPPTKKRSIENLHSKLQNRKLALLCLTFDPVQAVPDILWGQYYKTQRALRKLLELNDFHVLRDTVWTDEKKMGAFVIELEQTVIPKIKRHIGPPIEKKNESENFLAKYVDNAEVISGPYLENGRWTVLLPRKHINAVKLLKTKLKDGGKNTGIADLFSEAFSKRFTVARAAEIMELYESNEEFAGFLTKFLDGKPFWLESTDA